MYCKECGTENRNDRKFCSNCGTPLKDYTKPAENLILPTEIEEKQETVKKKNDALKYLKFVSIAFFVVAVALTIISFFFNGTIFMAIIISAIVCYFVALCIIISCAIIKRRTSNKLNANND